VTTKTPVRTAPEIIATVLGWDWADVKANVYQPTRYSSPRVYVVGNAYMCSPTAKQTPPKGHFDPWTVYGEAYGRKVYVSGTR
jgi:hypothetical protein